MDNLPRQRLRTLIRQQWPRLTIRAFARRMGVSVPTLNAYLNGQRTPPDGFWIAAARDLGVDPSSILSEEDDRELVPA